MRPFNSIIPDDQLKTVYNIKATELKDTPPVVSSRYEHKPVVSSMYHRPKKTEKKTEKIEVKVEEIKPILKENKTTPRKAV